MKKLLLFITFICSSFTINAQELSYGVVLGSTFEDYEFKGSLVPSINYNLINFGFFGEYQINKNTGVKANLTYSAKMVDRGYSFRTESLSVKGDEINLSAINFSTHFKFDTNSEYLKGFYLLAGPRFTFVLSAEEDISSNDIKDFYNSTRIAAQFGFGVNFLKHFGFELIGDYGLNNIIDSEENKIQSAGVNFNLTINLESLINK